MDSAVYAALCHTRRQLYGPVGSSESPTFDHLSIWARRKKKELQINSDGGLSETS